MTIVRQRQLRRRADRLEADRLHEPPDIPAGGAVDADGGAKPWPSVGYAPGFWGAVCCASRPLEFVTGVVFATWPLCDAPNAAAAVTAAAPPATHAVRDFTRRRACVLSIAMS